MTDFINFEAVDDKVDDDVIIDNENRSDNNVSDCDFTDDENDFDENEEDNYAFANVSRGIEDAIQDSFINLDYSQEANNYCLHDYDPSEEIIDEFKESAKKVKDFKHTLLIPQGFENIDSFYYVILYPIRYQLKK